MKMEILEINALWLKQAGDRMTVRPEALLNGILIICGPATGKALGNQTWKYGWRPPDAPT